MPKGRLTLVAVAAVMAASLTFAESTALARKKRAVVLGFSGPGGGRVRAGLIGGLRRRAKMISPKVFVRTARKLGVRTSSAEGRAAVCARLRCHAVVDGSVRRARRRRYRVTVTVFNGLDGEVIGRRAATARSRRRLARTGRALARACARLIGRGRYGQRRVAAAAPPPPAPPPAAPPPAAAPPAGDGQPQIESDTQPRTAQTAPPVEDELFSTRKRPRRSDEEEEEEEDGRVSKRGRSSFSGLFDLAASIGLATRSYELAGANAAENSTYDGGMYPEFTARLEFYPLVLAMRRGFWRNLGIGFSFNRHISISTKLPSANTEVDTSSQEILIDARLRWAFTYKPTSPAVVIYGGFGMRDFDLGPNIVLPSFNYKFLRFGLDGMVPIGTPLVALFAGFDARPLVGIGQEAVDAYGVRDGGFGWSVRGGATGKHFATGVFYFVAFEYLAFSSNFAGRSDARANTIERSEPTEGADTFIRLWAGAGYSL